MMSPRLWAALSLAAIVGLGCDPVYTTRVTVEVRARTVSELRDALPLEVRLLDLNDGLGRTWSLGLICPDADTDGPFVARFSESGICAEEQHYVAYLVAPQDGADLQRCGVREPQRVATTGARPGVPDDHVGPTDRARLFVGASSSDCGEGEDDIVLEL